MKVQGQIPPSTGYTLFYCSSLYRASQMCFLQIETGPSTSKRTTTRFIGALWNRTRGIAKLCLELFLGRKTVALGDLICHLSRQWRHNPSFTRGSQDFFTRQKERERKDCERQAQNRQYKRLRASAFLSPI